ncbi:MAG: rhomboid family intramembrane serine protease GlpG [Paraglaciecola sp.]|nr:rhomboid family intramembrane serine protease GlpG [Paraglaciecola sp.]NCT46673.1 rhomboid family intramembrane serine protease GlpG [Paraglaciecola sp.]
MLVNYLITQHIAAHYVRLDQQQAHGVVISDALQLPEAQHIAQEFIANPHQEKYQDAVWQAGESVSMANINWFSFAAIRAQLKQTPFTALILLSCLVIYALEISGFTSVYASLRILPWPQLVADQQWWRLIGPALIHFSSLHIIFNLLWWWMLGQQLEQNFGLMSLVLLFLSSAIFSNVAQLILEGPNFGGLSGVVYALVGCVWWLGWLRPSWGISLPQPLIIFLLLWLVIGYADVLWIPMANVAHTAGLIAGCLFALLLVQIPKLSRR